MRRVLHARVIGIASRQHAYSSSNLRSTPLVTIARPFQTHSKDHARPATQAFEGYSEDPLDAPLRSLSPALRSPPAPPVDGDGVPESIQDQQLAKARVVFGSRLAGPGERKAALDAVSTNVAGVLVPPRPEEPDNCCVGGCVNCVWVQYRKEMEHWAAQTAEAKRRLWEMRNREKTTAQNAGQIGALAAGMDEDGGGSDASWDTAAGGQASTSEDMFAGIPVGIREFMKTEKMLQAKRDMDQAANK